MTRTYMTSDEKLLWQIFLSLKQFFFLSWKLRTKLIETFEGELSLNVAHSGSVDKSTGSSTVRSPI